MNRTAAFLISLVLVIAAGVVHGLWSDRWGRSEELEQALANVAQVPMRVGDWVAEEVEGDARSFDQAGAQAYFVRTYTHRRSKASLVVILMCGRAGRMAVHTPEVCYQGAGYMLMGAPVSAPLRTELGEDLGNLWTARFGKGAGMESMRLYWGWSTTGPWHAATDPRWQFRGEPFLYKLYIAHDAPHAATPAADGPPQQFLRRFLPALDEARRRGPRTVSH